jgi:hypothetical protein
MEDEGPLGASSLPAPLRASHLPKARCDREEKVGSPSEVRQHGRQKYLSRGSQRAHLHHEGGLRNRVRIRRRR